MEGKPKIVVLSGSGISAESGIPTFRGADGLWEGHRWQDVATPEAFDRNPELVLRFYNQRRSALSAVSPHGGHLALARLEEKFDVQIITQNVDDLHERAGSSKIMHLHGELKKARSVADPRLILDWEGDIHLGDLGPDGRQLRPHIVWFGEEVPLIPSAALLVGEADILLVVGSSLVVYPANSLVDYAPAHARIYVVDPNPPHLPEIANEVVFITQPASQGLPYLARQLMAELA